MWVSVRIECWTIDSFSFVLLQPHIRKVTLWLCAQPSNQLSSNSTFPFSTYTFRMLKVLQRKLVVVGDGACGKTSLLLFFNNRQFHTVRSTIRASHPFAKDRSLLTLIQLGTYTHCLWEHCKGFWSRWPTCRTCVIWYCRYVPLLLVHSSPLFTDIPLWSRPRRLWSFTTPCLSWYTCCFDLLFSRYTRFTR